LGVLEIAQAEEFRMSCMETTELRLRKVKKERVAVIKFGVNERGCDGPSSGKVESVILRRSRIDKKQDLETEEI